MSRTNVNPAKAPEYTGATPLWLHRSRRIKELCSAIAEYTGPDPKRCMCAAVWARELSALTQEPGEKGGGDE